MAKVILMPAAFGDLDRIASYHTEQPSRARTRLRAIREAISMLARHPLIGRIVNDELRELVISRGKDGFIALYRYVAHADHVRVLRIRHQRELGYPQR